MDSDVCPLAFGLLMASSHNNVLAHSMHDENATLECSHVHYQLLMGAFGSIVVRALRSLTPEAADQVHAMYGNISVLNSRFSISGTNWEELTRSAYSGDTDQCTSIGREHLRRLRRRIDNPVHVKTVEVIIEQLTS
eukprot:gene14374-20377_t